MLRDHGLDYILGNVLEVAPSLSHQLQGSATCALYGPNNYNTKKK